MKSHERTVAQPICRQTPGARPYKPIDIHILLFGGVKQDRPTVDLSQCRGRWANIESTMFCFAVKSINDRTVVSLVSLPPPPAMTTHGV